MQATNNSPVNPNLLAALLGNIKVTVYITLKGRNYNIAGLGGSYLNEIKKEEEEKSEEESYMSLEDQRMLVSTLNKINIKSSS